MASLCWVFPPTKFTHTQTPKELKLSRRAWRSEASALNLHTELTQLSAHTVTVAGPKVSYYKVKCNFPWNWERKGERDGSGTDEVNKETKSCQHRCKGIVHLNEIYRCIESAVTLRQHDRATLTVPSVMKPSLVLCVLSWSPCKERERERGWGGGGWDEKSSIYW